MVKNKYIRYKGIGFSSIRIFPMVELSLIALLNSVGDNFCEYRSAGNDPYKSLLLSYSDASQKFGVEKVKGVIQDSESLKFSAVAVALMKCPQHL